MGNCFQTFSIKRRMPSARRRPKSWKGAYCWVPVGSPACTASASERCMLRCKQKIGDRKMQFPQMGMHFRSNAQRKFPFQHMFLNVLFHSPNCETTHWGIDCKVSEISNSDICRMVFSLQISASAFFVSTWSKRRRDIRELTLESSHTRVVGSSEPIVVLKGRNGSTLCVVYWNSLYLRPHNT